MKNKLGTVGILIAMLAITVAVFQVHIRVLIAPEDPTIKEQLMNKGSELLGLKSKHKISTSAATGYFDAVSITYTALGVIAMFFGVFSFLQKENHRFSGMAASLGIVAIAWEYVLIGLVIAFIVFLLANLDAF